MVFGVGTLKDITIYEVSYSAKPRKISFNVILSKAESHHGQVHRTQSHFSTKKKKKKKKKKTDLVSDDMCSSLYVSLTRLRRLSRCLVHSHVDISNTRGGSVHKYRTRSHIYVPFTHKIPGHTWRSRSQVGYWLSYTCVICTSSCE